MDLMVTVSASLDLIGNISSYAIDTFHAFSLYSLPSPSHECCNTSSVDYQNIVEENVVDCVESLGIFRGCDLSLDLYTLYLENMTAKIIMTTSFDYSTNFFKEFDKFRRALTIILRFMFKCSYSHSSELHAHVFNKLLQTLMTSKLAACILR